jgi:hypothetical protein
MEAEKAVTAQNLAGMPRVRVINNPNIIMMRGPDHKKGGMFSHPAFPYLNNNICYFLAAIPFLIAFTTPSLLVSLMVRSIPFFS